MAGQSVSVRRRTPDNAVQAAKILTVMEILRYSGSHVLTAAALALKRVLMERPGWVAFQ